MNETDTNPELTGRPKDFSRKHSADLAPEATELLTSELLTSDTLINLLRTPPVHFVS